MLLDHCKSGNTGGFYGNGIGGFHAINFTLDVDRDVSGRPIGLKLEDPLTTLEPISKEKQALLSQAASGETFLSIWRWDDWNEFRITVRGALPTITTIINGTLVAELDAARLPPKAFDAEGTLALLGERGHVVFEVHDNDPKMGDALGTRGRLPVAQHPASATLRLHHHSRASRPTKERRANNVSKPSPEQYPSRPNGMLPNSRFPLLVHRGAIPRGGFEAVRDRFRANGWLNNWRYPGIYTYPHFHSTTHECLGCAAGWMEVELSGRGGTRVLIEAGDVIVMPAGVSHQMVGHNDDILMVGGYPDGRDWDNIQEEHITEETRRAAAKRIMMLPIPAKDPVTGAPMQEWIDAPSSVDADLNEFRDGLDPF